MKQRDGKFVGGEDSFHGIVAKIIGTIQPGAKVVKL